MAMVPWFSHVTGTPIILHGEKDSRISSAVAVACATTVSLFLQETDVMLVNPDANHGGIFTAPWKPHFYGPVMVNIPAPWFASGLPRNTSP